MICLTLRRFDKAVSIIYTLIITGNRTGTPLPRKTAQDYMDAQPTPAVAKQGYSHEKLMKALYFMLDLFSRPNIPYFLLEDTAKAVHDGRMLDGDHITVGIRKVDYQGPQIGIMDAFSTPSKVEGNRLTYEVDGVKAIVKVIDSDDDMFRNLNTFMYEYEPFSLPNPFEKYWEEKDKYL